MKFAGPFLRQPPGGGPEKRKLDLGAGNRGLPQVAAEPSEVAAPGKPGQHALDLSQHLPIVRIRPGETEAFVEPLHILRFR